ASAVAHDGPLLHTLAGENDALVFLDVDDEQAAASQQQVLDLNLPAHAVGQEHVLQPIDRDRFDGTRDLGAAILEPTKVDSDGGEHDQHPDRSRNRYLSCHVNKPLHAHVFIDYNTQPHA